MSQPARFCIRCGAAVPVADSRFCFSCGAETVAPVAAPPPRPDQQRSTGFTNDKPSPEWWTPGLRRKLRIAAELFCVWLITNTLAAFTFGYPVNPIAGFVVAGGYFWWRCWRQNPRQTPDRGPPLDAPQTPDKETPPALPPRPPRQPRRPAEQPPYVVSRGLVFAILITFVVLLAVVIALAS